MSIRFLCPSCGKKLNVGDEAAGRRAKCPQCQTIVKVPGHPAAPPPARNKTAAATKKAAGEDDLDLDSLSGLATGSDVSAEERAAIDAARAPRAKKKTEQGVRLCPACQFVMDEGVTVCPFCHTDCSAVASISRRSLGDPRSRGKKIRDAALLLAGVVVLAVGAFWFIPRGSTGDDAGTIAAKKEEESRSPSQWLHETLLGPDAKPGNKTFGNIIPEDSGETAKLPFTIQSAALQTSGYAEIEDGKIASGSIFGPRETLEAKPEQAGVSEFAVPEGQRMIQVRYQTKDVRSIVSQIMNYVGQINQYFVRERYQGVMFPLAGYVGIVQRGGEDFAEIYYNGDPYSPYNAGFTCMLDFKHIERLELNEPTTRIYLLFLVPAGTEIFYVENQTGEGDFFRITASSDPPASAPTEGVPEEVEETDEP